MSYEYAERKPEQTQRKTAADPAAAESISAPRQIAGKGGADASGTGGGANLANAMQSRIQNTFGADLDAARAPRAPMGGAQPMNAPITPLSTVSAASAAGPMQAKKGKKKEKPMHEQLADQAYATYNRMSQEYQDELPQIRDSEIVDTKWRRTQDELRGMALNAAAAREFDMRGNGQFNDELDDANLAFIDLVSQRAQNSESKRDRSVYASIAKMINEGTQWIDEQVNPVQTKGTRRGEEGHAVGSDPAFYTQWAGRKRSYEKNRSVYRLNSRTRKPESVNVPDDKPSFYGLDYEDEKERERQRELEKLARYNETGEWEEDDD